MKELIASFARLTCQRNVYFRKDSGKLGFLLPPDSKLKIGEVYEDGEVQGWVGVRFSNLPSEAFVYGPSGLSVHPVIARAIVLWLFVEGKISDARQFEVQATTDKEGKRYLNVKPVLTDRVTAESLEKVVEMLNAEKVANADAQAKLGAVLAKLK